MRPPGDFSVNEIDADSGEPMADVFYREISAYWPAVERSMLVPDYAGIRPKLSGPVATGSCSGIVHYKYKKY